ncbi:hypothetical protein [Massilia sp. METH4]|uniref:hypothetical protein n=1 Tax=Massilia sp. METH4 TaxID=3123041 RepID=UPI0030D21CD0
MAGGLLSMVGDQFTLLALPWLVLELTGDALAGLLLAPLGGVDAMWQAITAAAALGVQAGFLQVAIFTWIQRRVPPRMPGRAMSIVLFIFMGLAPLSAAATGAMLRHVSLATLFAASGAGVLRRQRLAVYAAAVEHRHAGPLECGLIRNRRKHDGNEMARRLHLPGRNQ